MKTIEAPKLLICLLLIGIIIIALTFFKVSPGNLIFAAVLLACPLLHIFLMKDHEKHSDHNKTK